MTSAVTRKTTESAPFGRPHAPPTSPLRARAAFTLFELVLAVSLVALLCGLVVLSAGNWSDSRRLDEGARRFETMLRMARAEAANLAREIRVQFETDEAGSVRIRLLWQADPISAPKEFTEYSACTWTHYIPEGLVEVARSELTGESAYRLLESDMRGGQQETEEGFDPVTFYPDGSCDSAEIELVSTSEDDERVVLITIHGLTGTIDRRVLSAEELLAERAE